MRAPRFLQILQILLYVFALHCVSALAAINCPGDLATWWKFEGNGNDAQGAAPLTLLNGAGFALGEVLDGLSLDGINDYATAPAGAALDVGAASGMTIETWIRPSNTPTVPETCVPWPLQS